MPTWWNESAHSLLRVARFFIVVPVVPRIMLVAFGVATFIGAAALATDRSLGVRTVAPVLLLQLFAAASGFVVPARRGHYDVLLTRGDSRLAIAVMHWIMSVTPGIVSWVVLAGMEWAVGGQSLIVPGTLLSLLVVSTVPWALTVPLPRLTGGIVWLLAFALVSVALPGPTGPATSILVPWTLLGTSPDPLSAAIVTCCIVLTMGVTLGWVSRMDVPLESGQ